LIDPRGTLRLVARQCKCGCSKMNGAAKGAGHRSAPKCAGTGRPWIGEALLSSAGERQRTRCFFPNRGCPMHCYVYASLRKADSYLWLAARDDFSMLPESLLLLLGELRFVLEVQLDEQRKLPQEDTRQILDHLRQQGWHLQLPPNETLASANHPAYKHSPQDERDD
jgi:uncharacterized protein YcgL (UPF0745 family)